MVVDEEVEAGNGRGKLERISPGDDDDGSVDDADDDDEDDDDVEDRKADGPRLCERDRFRCDVSEGDDEDDNCAVIELILLLIFPDSLKAARVTAIRPAAEGL